MLSLVVNDPKPSTVPWERRDSRGLVVTVPEVDLCPICGATGWETCVEEDGQYVLDHFGRPAELFGRGEQVAINAEDLAAAS